MPYWLGYVSAFTEFAGGIILIIGFLTRFAAFMIAINMVFAIIMVNRHHGYPGFGVFPRPLRHRRDVGLLRCRHPGPRP